MYQSYLVKSWNSHSIVSSDSYNAYIDSGFTAVTGTAQYNEVIQLDDFPKLGGVTLSGYDLPLTINMQGTLVNQERELTGWFSPLDTTPHKLIVTDAYSSTDFYIYAIPTKIDRGPDGPGQLVITLHASDPVWKQNTVSTDTWTVTATSSDQTHVVTTAGNVDSYPVFTLTPTTDRTGTGSYKYGVFVEVYNQSTSDSCTSRATELAYGPTTDDVWDTAALVADNKMQSAGQDLRVFVDGVERDRWIDNVNTTDTRVWTYLDIAAPQVFTLAVALTSDGVGSSEITVNEDLSTVASAGILKIESERFTYTGKNTTTKKFTGVTYAAKETVAAAHSAAAVVRYVDHDIWIYYGSSDSAAPTAAVTGKPMFTTSDSNNWTWAYTLFRDDAYTRSNEWETDYEPATFWTTDGIPGTAYSTDGAPVAGVRAGQYHISEVGLNTSFKYTGWSVTTAAKYGATDAGWSTDIGLYNAHKTSTTDGLSPVYSVPVPSLADTWEAWNTTDATTGTYISLFVKGTSTSATVVNEIYIEDITITFSSTDIPVVSRSAEVVAPYVMDTTLTNTTTGESLDINYQLTINDVLEINTKLHTATNITDNEDAITAISLPLRPQWLRLQPGANTLTYTETGVQGVTIGIEWEDRVL
jgi:hypothetical protein